MTSKIVVNNIESDSGISSVTVVSDIAGQDSTQNISGINSVTAISFHGNLIGNVTGNITGSGANLTNIPTVSDINNLINNVSILGFKVATNGSLAKYSLVNQVIDEFTDSSGIDASASTNETLSSGYYYGVGSGGSATGGTITTYGAYKVHSFLSSGTWTPPGAGTVDVLIVAGGGGGGAGRGGGGGAGGMLYRTGLSVTGQAYTITVGDGGAGATGHSNPAVNGQDSVAFSVTAKGGGRGGTGVTGTTSISIGAAGGSSGGTTHGADGAVASNQGTFSGWTAKGNAGGNGNGSDNESAGGGGGAGAAGQAGDASGNGGDGGIGFQNDYRTGSNVYYAGGGGAGFGADSGATSGAGGNGGGGAGTAGTSTGSSGAGTGVGPPTDGTPNTGGGGGGGSYFDSGFSSSNVHGADGGSGIVVIRYNATTGIQGVADLTLQSVDTTAVDGAPTKADLIMLIENATGTATLNTDIKGFISRDSGTTFTQGTLVDEGSYATSTKRIVAFHDLDISGQPSGTSVCYKITTHNQSASKTTRIHAVSHGWK
tara:strand:+ start:227 stop:1852 length:1626 start_codon:yes stop_codon:yes gene_type:complete